MMKKFLFLALFLSALPAVAQVADTLEFDKGVSTNPAMLLRGRVSGVRVSATDGNPSGVVNVSLRGLNSLRGDSSPLWIVDGVRLAASDVAALQPFWQYGDYSYLPRLSAMEGFNLYDIESIEVLKDLSAAALYGGKGANGVIVVKTKRSKRNVLDASFHANAGIGVANRSSEHFRHGMAHNYDFAVGSANGRNNFRLSGFFRDMQGAMDGIGNKAGGGRLAFDTRTNDVFWCGFSTMVSAVKISSLTGTARFGAPSAMLSVRNIAAIDGQSGSVGGWLRDFDDADELFNASGSFYVQVNFSRFLNLRTSLSLDSRTSSRSVWYGDETAFGKAENGAAALSWSSLLSYTADAKLNYNRYFGTLHGLNLSVGAEISGDKNRYNTMNGVNFFYHELRAKGLSLMDCVPVIRKFDYSFLEPAIAADASYDYGSLAGVSLSVRADRNNRFDDNFSIWPSVSVYADLRKLAGIGGKTLSALRLEAGYGRAGIRRFIPYHNLSSFTGGYYLDVPDELAAFYDAFNRLDSREYNASLKAGLLDDRIGIKIGVYSKRTDDALDLYCSGQEEGTNGIWEKTAMRNVSSQQSTVCNKGVEIDINASVIRRRGFLWDAFGNISINSNRITSLHEFDASGIALDDDGIVVTRNIEGRSVSGLYGYLLSSDNQVLGEGFIGNSVPAVLAGFGSSLKYGLLTVDLQFDSAACFDILNMNRMVASGELYASQAFVEPGDYLRLSRASLAFDIPVRDKVSWLKGLSVSVTGTNLLTLTSYSGWNPDVNSFGFTNLSYGIDYGSYPLMRSFVIGVSAKF